MLDGTCSFLQGTNTRHLLVLEPAEPVAPEISKYGEQSYPLQVFHHVTIVDRNIWGVFPTFNWYSPGSLNKPTCECLATKLRSLRSEAYEVPLLGVN